MADQAGYPSAPAPEHVLEGRENVRGRLAEIEPPAGRRDHGSVTDIGPVVTMSGPGLTPPASIDDLEFRGIKHRTSDRRLGRWSWRGNPGHALDTGRSFSPGDLPPLSDVPRGTLIGVQNDCDDELGGLPIRTLGDDFQDGDWLETAGILANLDLAVSCDNGIAHLAAPSGTPAGTST